MLGNATDTHVFIGTAAVSAGIVFAGYGLVMAPGATLLAMGNGAVMGVGRGRQRGHASRRGHRFGYER